MNTSPEFKKCLEHNKIKKFSSGRKLMAKELKLAQEDLRLSLRNLNEGNYRWSIVQSYYSMFHSARVLLYSKNYREKNHFCLIIAVRSLFVETGKLNFSFIEFLLEAKHLREAADYYGDFSEVNSRKLVKKAKYFLKIVKEVTSVQK